MFLNGSRPIIIVTGANTGVGFGICHRLIVQLTNGCQEAVSNELESSCDGLTLILACRSKQRAEAAQDKLYAIADEQVRQAERSPGYDGKAGIFRKNLLITVHIVDLADVQSVFRFADDITQSYPYISRLVCNAGVVCFTQIVWPVAIYQLLTDWASAVSKPKFYRQSVGDVSQDGLGWVFQCNVFGHYALFRALEPMLSQYTAADGARVVWISSHEAGSEFYDPKDWQLVKSEHSYQCSKYQMNIMSLYLDREAIRDQLNGKPAVRHLTAYPGVAATNIATAILGTFTSLCMYATFYIARFLGSTDHPISVFKAAVSAVYLTLAHIGYLPSVRETATSTNPRGSVEVGTVYAAKTDRWGHEYTGMIKLIQSQEDEAQAKELLANCDRLLKTLCDVQGRPSPTG